MATRSTRTRTTSRRPPSSGAATGTGRATPPGPEPLSRSLSESAQQIWLAGIGAFSRAQAEGTRLFEGLVREGMGLEQQARRVAGHQAEAARRNVEHTVESARERASETWERLEKGFEERVHRTLVRLGVPDRQDLADLSRRVDALTAELRRHGGGPSPARAAKRPAATGTAAAKKAGVRSAATTPPARKPPSKAASRRTRS